MGNADFQDLATVCVQTYYNERIAPKIPLREDEIYVVWMVKVLQNNKALLATMREDGLYFEVTFNGAEREVYLDHYRKMGQEVIREDGDAY